MVRSGTGISISGPELADLSLGRHKGVVFGQATAALTQDDSGKHFVCAVDAVITLPASADVGAGCVFIFECGAVSSGTGLSISPVAADGIALGGAATGALDKDLINSGATDALGDRVAVVSTGVAGTAAWKAFGKVGTWAKEA